MYLLFYIISLFSVVTYAMETADQALHRRKRWLEQSLIKKCECEKQLKDTRLSAFKRLQLQTALQIENRRIESLQPWLNQKDMQLHEDVK